MGTWKRKSPSATVRARVLFFLVLLLPSASFAEPPSWQPGWRRTSLFEGLALIPAGAALVLIETQIPPPDPPNWEGGILFDNAVRDLLAGSSRDQQQTAAAISDVLYLWGSAIPVIVDVGVVALGVHQNPDLALQLLLMDLQSLAVTGLFTLTAEHTVGRARPYYEDCDADGQVLDSNGELLHTCGPKDAMSFWSGHTALTATVAGLTCVHHQYLALYGGGFADLAPCLVTIGVSITTGIERMVADEHWATDVILGWGVGAVAGYLLPRWLHYDWPSGGEDAPSSTVTLVPLSGGLGLTWSGLL